MIERTPIFNMISQIVLFLGLLLSIFPFAIVLISATYNIRDVNMVPVPL